MFNDKKNIVREHDLIVVAKKKRATKNHKVSFVRSDLKCLKLDTFFLSLFFFQFRTLSADEKNVIIKIPY